MFEMTVISLWLTLPIVVGGVAHMFFVANDWLPSLKVAIAEKPFGKNKTWRGVIVMPLVTVPGALLLGSLSNILPDRLALTLESVSLIVLGLSLGLGYVIFELPNSYIKRRVGIAPGATPTRGRLWFIAMDQLDSAFGFTLVYAVLLDLPALTYVLLLIQFPFVALLVKRILYWVRLKKSYL
jgi:CDP-archaeol synthase